MIVSEDDYTAAAILKNKIDVYIEMYAELQHLERSRWTCSCTFYTCVTESDYQELVKRIKTL